MFRVLEGRRETLKGLLDKRYTRLCGEAEAADKAARQQQQQTQEAGDEAMVDADGPQQQQRLQATQPLPTSARELMAAGSGGDAVEAAEEAALGPYVFATPDHVVLQVGGRAGRWGWRCCYAVLGCVGIAGRCWRGMVVEGQLGLPWSLAKLLLPPPPA